MQLTNMKSQVRTIDRGSYRWRQFFNCWTGRPEFALYFPATTLESGDTLPSMYITSVAHNRDDGTVEWYRIRFYGQLADQANTALQEMNRVAMINAEGIVARRLFKDRHGNDREEDFVIVSSAEHIKVLGIREHIGGNGDDPFHLGIQTETSNISSSTTSHSQHTESEHAYDTVEAPF